MVATAAGLLLVGLGIAGLWRSRRRDESRPRRYLRRFLLAVAGVFVALWFIQGSVLGFYATHSVRTPAAADPNLGRSYQQVSFRSADGLELVGWYVPSRNRVAVIVFPGRHSTVAPARMLVRHGYGVLLFDRRGEGRAKVTRTLSAGAVTVTCWRRSAISSSAPISTRRGSAASAFPLVAS
jgi:hypothetical protein